MLKHAESLDFELAAKFRDELIRLESFDLEIPASTAPLNPEILASIYQKDEKANQKIRAGRTSIDKQKNHRGRTKKTGRARA